MRALGGRSDVPTLTAGLGLALVLSGDLGGATSAPSWEPPPACRWADRNVRHGVRGRCRGRLLEPLVKPGTNLLGLKLRALPLLTGDDDTGCRDSRETGQTSGLPEIHEQETLP
jgi:hypothetical protein